MSGGDMQQVTTVGFNLQNANNYIEKMQGVFVSLEVTAIKLHQATFSIH